AADRRGHGSHNGRRNHLGDTSGGPVRCAAMVEPETPSEQPGPRSSAAVAPPQGTPRLRYTAALAEAIETSWQDRWEREGTFFTPNPVGELSTGFEAVADRPKL